ncbi:hypothetical protein T12_6025 [Trichinella patagoniensis]|uniref:Uncharacterized protein n=1 Tax=Trichinella patagoniensis TaxID=990121 RepID=A0A0V0ZTV9_9BILA|nr:hypothetical protein T12_6025 [Trichinella patagoniensis]
MEIKLKIRNSVTYSKLIAKSRIKGCRFVILPRRLDLILNRQRHYKCDGVFCLSQCFCYGVFCQISKPNSMNINNEKMTPFAVSAVAGKFKSYVSKLVVIVVDVLIGLEQKLIMQQMTIMTKNVNYRDMM